MAAKLLWKPTEKFKTGSKMYEFLTHISEKYYLPDNEYSSIHEWSVHNIGNFWAEIWDFCNIKYSQKFTQVVDDPHKMPGAKWFSGARLNFAENLTEPKR